MKKKQIRIILFLAFCSVFALGSSLSWADNDEFREALLSSDASISRSATEQMLKKGLKEIKAEVLPTLQDILRSPEDNSRLTGSLTLYLLIGMWKNDSQEGLLTEGDVALQTEEKTSLYSASIPLVKTSLGDTDPRVRVLGIASVGALSMSSVSEEVRTLPLSLLNDPEPKVREAAVGTLAYFKPGTAQVEEALLLLLQKEENTSVRAKAFRVIGALGFTDAEVRKILLRVLREEEHQGVRGEAFRAI